MGPFNPLSGGPGAFGGVGADLNETSAGAVADSESDTENWSPVSNASGRGSAGKTFVLLALFWFDIALIISAVGIQSVAIKTVRYRLIQSI